MSTMKSTKEVQKVKRIYVEVDDETMLTLSYLYKKELSETADLPSQSFTLRMLREVFKALRYMHPILRYILENRLAKIKDELDTLLVEINTFVGEAIANEDVQDIDVMIVIGECYFIQQDLHVLLRELIAGFIEALKHHLQLFEKLCSEDSDEDIIEEISSRSKLIEEVYNAVANLKIKGDIIKRRYRNIRYRILSFAVEN